MRLFANRAPDSTFTEQRDHKTYQVQLWDTEGLPFTADYPEPVRGCARRKCWNETALAREN